MKNPNGPYPGRQLFLGLTNRGRPAFAYLVTGRSPQSRERQAIPVENGVIVGPLGNKPYDPLRHYTAVKYDNDIGLLVVSNGIQTEAIFETYKLLYHTGSAPAKGYLKKIMDGARSEPDSLNTPRIAGLITKPSSEIHMVYLMGIKIRGRPAIVLQPETKAGKFNGISTYSGDIEAPTAFKIDSGLPSIESDANTPEEVAEFIFEISKASYHGEDIRVCTVGGMLSDDNRTWKVAITNRHEN